MDTAAQPGLAIDGSAPPSQGRRETGSNLYSLASVTDEPSIPSSTNPGLFGGGPWARIEVVADNGEKLSFFVFKRTTIHDPDGKERSSIKRDKRAEIKYSLITDGKSDEWEESGDFDSLSRITCTERCQVQQVALGVSSYRELGLPGDIPDAKGPVVLRQELNGARRIRLSGLATHPPVESPCRPADSSVRTQCA